MKIHTIVAYANHSQISFMTQRSIDAITQCGDWELDVVVAQGSNIVRNRNAAINGERSYAIRQKIGDFDFLLCLDSDVAFNAGHLRRLLNHNLDIVGGAYQKRNRIDLMCAGYWFDGIEGVTSDDLCPKWSEEGLKKVDWVGSGFLLVKRQVLEAMEYPWFRYEIVRFEHNGVVHQLVTSDDFGFDMNARRAGYDIYLDCSCKIEHMALKTGGIIADVSASMKEKIIAEELEKVEIEIYRTALKLQALEGIASPQRNECTGQLQGLQRKRAGFLQERERIHRTNILRVDEYGHIT